MHDHNDFDFEDSPGIPAPLPPGEHVLWQGSPDFREIAKNAFHIRKIALYFALILAIQTVSVFQSGSAALGASLSLTIMLSALGLGILVLLAWLTSRVTIYTVTNCRVLIRFGIALQMTMNLPFSQISAADMRKGKDGFGDIPLSVKDSRRVSYLVLWPNVRPWAFSKPQPMLRSIANVSHVAGIIADVAANRPVHTRIEKASGKSPVRAPARGVSGASADAVLMKPEVS